MPVKPQALSSIDPCVSSLTWTLCSQAPLTYWAVAGTSSTVPPLPLLTHGGRRGEDRSGLTVQHRVQRGSGHDAENSKVGGSHLPVSWSRLPKCSCCFSPTHYCGLSSTQVFIIIFVKCCWFLQSYEEEAWAGSYISRERTVIICPLVIKLFCANEKNVMVYQSDHLLNHLMNWVLFHSCHSALNKRSLCQDLWVPATPGWLNSEKKWLPSSVCDITSPITA